MVSAVAVGKIGDKIASDITKEEEDYSEDGQKAATDIPIAILNNTGEISLLQLDGEMPIEMLKEAIEAGKKACAEIYELQKKVLKGAS